MRVSPGGVQCSCGRGARTRRTINGRNQTSAMPGMPAIKNQLMHAPAGGQHDDQFGAWEPRQKDWKSRSWEKESEGAEERRSGGSRGGELRR
jgi:hypothetical protein